LSDTRWIVGPLSKTLQLVRFADVQEELQNVRAVCDEAALEIVSPPVTLPQDLLGHQTVDARDKRILIVRAIENHDLPRLGNCSSIHYKKSCASSSGDGCLS